MNRRRMMGMAACATAAWPVMAEKKPSDKKGFGIGIRKCPDWATRLQQLNARWFYTWGSEMPEGIPAGMEFVPIIWGKRSCKDEVMQRLIDEKHKTLLGFNEPEHHKQGNMTVDEALELWPMLMDTGMRLGSPAGVQADGEWMRAFMKEAKKRSYRVDFIAVHSYRGSNPRYFLKWLEKIHKRYKLPLWITELAVADWEARDGKPNRYSPEDVFKFMETVLPVLERLDYMERYAWFSAPKPKPAVQPSALFHPDGTLTQLGELYASF